MAKVNFLEWQKNMRAEALKREATEVAENIKGQIIKALSALNGAEGERQKKPALIIINNMMEDISVGKTRRGEFFINIRDWGGLFGCYGGQYGFPETADAEALASKAAPRLAAAMIAEREAKDNFRASNPWWYDDEYLEEDNPIPDHWYEDTCLSSDWDDEDFKDLWQVKEEAFYNALRTGEVYPL